ncbi:MAG: hypothetical protein AAF512_10940 [Pseudomonadota bacterium]
MKVPEGMQTLVLQRSHQGTEIPKQLMKGLLLGFVLFVIAFLINTFLLPNSEVDFIVIIWTPLMLGFIIALGIIPVFHSLGIGKCNQLIIDSNGIKHESHGPAWLPKLSLAGEQNNNWLIRWSDIVSISVKPSADNPHFMSLIISHSAVRQQIILPYLWTQDDTNGPSSPELVNIETGLKKLPIIKYLEEHQLPFHIDLPAFEKYENGKGRRIIIRLAFVTYSILMILIIFWFAGK